MIVVDSSVWIPYLRNDHTERTERLDDLLDREQIVVGDIVMCEILQGVRNEAEAARVETILRGFHLAAMRDVELAVRAAQHYRRLRSIGITIRKTVDLIIGTFCIENDHALLHDDRDFAHMERHLGLRVV
jgi:predicted nucleic acid-binding protein